MKFILSLTLADFTALVHIKIANEDVALKALLAICVRSSCRNCTSRSYHIDTASTIHKSLIYFVYNYVECNRYAMMLALFQGPPRFCCSVYVQYHTWKWKNDKKPGRLGNTYHVT